MTDYCKKHNLPYVHDCGIDECPACVVEERDALKERNNLLEKEIRRLHNLKIRFEDESWNKGMAIDKLAVKIKTLQKICQEMCSRCARTETCEPERQKICMINKAARGEI